MAKRAGKGKRKAVRGAGRVKVGAGKPPPRAELEPPPVKKVVFGKNIGHGRGRREGEDEFVLRMAAEHGLHPLTVIGSDPVIHAAGMDKEDFTATRVRKLIKQTFPLALAWAKVHNEMVSSGKAFGQVVLTSALWFSAMPERE